MIAYNKKNIDALQINKFAKAWFAAGLIDGEAKKSLDAAYVSDFKTTPPLAKVGLFIFTLIGCLASAGFLMALVGFRENEIGWGIALVIVSVVAVIVNENFIKNNHYYRSGVDNALIYFSSSALLGGFAFFLNRMDDVSLLMYLIAAIVFKIGRAHV